MKLNLKYDFNATCKAILSEQFEKLGIPYKIHGPGEVEIERAMSDTELKDLVAILGHYGIEILDDQRMALVQRIKYAIDEMLEVDSAQSEKISCFLADKLNYSYSYLSSLFSEMTYMSIENFVILRKVDRAKQLLAETDLTLTEIAYQLNYSSVAHLSGQFKKTTGLTPTTFQNILVKRSENGIQTA